MATIVRVVALLLLAASALVGGNVLDLRDRLFGAPVPAPVAVGRSLTSPPTSSATPGRETVLRSQPWWQQVVVLRGAAPGRRTEHRFVVTDEALQWRVRFRCDAGRLVARAGGSVEPVVAGRCDAGELTGYASSRGKVALAVAADGAWTATVEQQVDVPLEEPPTAAMADGGTRAVRRGVVYDIDQAGTGTATILRLADGRHVLRLSDFYVSPNSDLEVRLSDVASPRTTADFLSGSSVHVATLDVTAGALNFEVPPEVDPSSYRSLVIWCERLKSAYAAAPLEPAE